jgi:hypothetical protein
MGLGKEPGATEPGPLDKRIQTARGAVIPTHASEYINETRPLSRTVSGRPQRDAATRAPAIPSNTTLDPMGIQNEREPIAASTAMPTSCPATVATSIAAKTTPADEASANSRSSGLAPPISRPAPKGGQEQVAKQ